MLNKATFLAAAVVLFSGCASVPMANKSLSDQAKLFTAPPEGQAGLYIYRDSNFGASLKKDIWVDGVCVGESAPKTFFYETVEGGRQHTISTESEFSPNNLRILVESGVNYFIRQSIKVGVLVGGAKLQMVSATKGQKAVSALPLAQGGGCSN